MQEHWGGSLLGWKGLYSSPVKWRSDLISIWDTHTEKDMGRTLSAVLANKNGWEMQQSHAFSFFNRENNLALASITHSHTFLADGLKISSEVFVAVSQCEWQQHGIGCRHQRERAGHRLTQPAVDRNQRSLLVHVWVGSYRTFKCLWSDPHRSRMRPLMGSRASYTNRASSTQSLGSMRNKVTVSRIKNPGAAVSFTWQLTPPHDEKTFKGILIPRRLAYSFSIHWEPGRGEGNLGGHGGYTDLFTFFYLIYLLHLMYNQSAERLQRDTGIMNRVVDSWGWAFWQ